MCYLYRHDYPYPLFEGAFSYNNEIYHIKTNNNYHLYKRHNDPHLPQHWPMVIYRDSDLFDDDDNNINETLTPTPILNNPILVDSPSFTTSPLLSSRDLNRSHYFKNDVMCAMEELNYNQKLTGVRPHSPPPNIFNNTLDQYRDGTESTTPDVLWNKKRSYQKRDAPISTGCPNSRRSRL